MVSVMGRLCGQTYSFFLLLPRPRDVTVPHPECLISNRRKWEEAQVDSKQATEGDLGERIFWEPRWWRRGETWCPRRIRPLTFRSETHSLPPWGQQRESQQQYPFPQKQTSEGLNQNNRPRLTNLTEGQYPCNPECSQVGCIKHATWQVHRHN